MARSNHEQPRAGSVVVNLTTGGGDGIRTHGLYIANVALCQLSYTPAR